MKQFNILLFIALALLSCKKDRTTHPTTLTNKTGTIQVQFGLDTEQAPYYLIHYNNTLVLDTSKLGIIRKDADFHKNLQLESISEAIPISDQYTMPHGKKSRVNYEANQYTIKLKNAEGNRMDIVFNLSKNGVAFKYVFPETSTETKYITKETTSYNFVSNTKAWLQPLSKAKSGWEHTNPSYEENYEMGIDVKTKSPLGEGWVYPALFHTDSIWTVISETHLKRNYCGTHLKYNDSLKALQVTFPQKEEVLPNGALNPEATTPWETPWRILAIGNLASVMESTLGTDLAEPAIPIDIDSFSGGLSSWSWVLLKDDFTNYETSKKFIDYASNMQWQYCLIDADWDRKIGYDKMKDLTDYAKTKNVKVLVWYNSAGSWNTTPLTPKSKLLTPEDRASEFQKLNDIGVLGIKVDFFGGDGQSVIAYYHDILTDAARHKLAVNFHGATLPRGWHRTYPNLMTMEAIKGEEFITFFQGNADLQPSHCAMLPFTRNVYDPMDFTPMVLDSIPNIHRRTTKAFELALPILFTSGIQHIAEIPEGMAKQPDFVIELLKSIPVHWDDVKFISGFPGKEVVLARKKGDTWYVVGINGENTTKTLQLDLAFLSNETGFSITDGVSDLEKTAINPDSIQSITLKPYGGFVMKFQ